ncbi:ATP-binding protein [Beggiatoa leptomitoformis]|uniref:ATP-binding protein n=2 Tax=Beggiatoa leptomitoformis TaxID=288004 RepID=A0A2N9YJD5_9GAMM|nr:ATP-binding protein [Beggiatoa leptomitoformis]AUI70620.1 ATP-binding protein [Beggiatoa leptomitoformis]
MTSDEQLPILHAPSKAYRIFGDFTFEPTADREYLELGFSPSSVPLRQRWRNNGLSASFLGDYLTTFFPIDDANPSSIKRRKKIKGAVTYIANELLENAMKFSIEGSHLPVSIHLQLHSDRIIFYVTNSVVPGTTDKFYRFIEELRNSDPQELYIQQVEKNMEDEEGSSSGLGLLTMMNDYGASVAWRFDTIQIEPEETMVTTMVQLIV